jgi:murein DD-endopeptidase MepM/ murein hydrolase activator NlpD
LSVEISSAWRVKRVPQHAEGRHRRSSTSKHRVARSPIGLPLAGERGRATVLAAALGAALVTGVAGGTAAAATHEGSSGTSDAIGAGSTADPRVALGLLPDASQTGATQTGATQTGATRTGTDLAPAKDLTRIAAATGKHATTDIAAVTVKLKAKALSAPIAVETGAAWVNPNPTARVTSCFGRRWGRLHAGVDLAAPDGTPIVAAGAGVVTRAGEAEGYGNAILIDHGNGYLTHYGHLSVIGVKVGQHVAAGEQIGNEGSTGHSTGPHLHFEVHQGYYKNPIEPTQWMHEHGVDIAGCVTFTNG